ncbi:RNA 2',3'-cyclic phosphodiesterase [Micromonospora sp. WMMD882]|uniref:RNA 2',3'-cyclic phosphodiesterase n=1 Tax=Micromonospora sp. WMMD882 TaxID=3015151 RepID=UPI00248B813B|nr:RNA 2',3'-cyclic phosphodiesterase [Micromonospora sp. WMMD882]WBB77847.1 RNA 2',3'-cyclic phosphodiesterase [Micromonospora sp. WMMD882]
MRLFVAVDPPPEAVADLAAQIARLRIGAAAAAGVNVRLADPANAHVTLAFLGEVPADRLPAVRNAVGLAACRCRGPAPPRLRLGRGGRFGRGRATVLWVDVLGEVEPLHTLAGQLRELLRDAGLPYDERPFRPHLTIARPGDRIDVEPDRLTLDGYLGPVWPATELALVRSHLGPARRYERLATWPL